MREQFDLYDLNGTRDLKGVCLISAGQYANLETLVVVPVFHGPPDEPRLPIHTEIDFAGHQYTAKFELLASIPAASLGEKIGHIREQKYELKNALDRLIAGY
ncbi:MAG: CcdB family protein [Pseudomonadota bacterium]